MRYEFSDVEFQVLCERYRGGSMPSPMVFTSRTRFLDDYQRELAEVRTELARRLDAGFESVFAPLADPDLFIVSHTWCDADMDNPDKRIRVHGARRDRRACLVIQQPAETIYHSNGFTLIECEPEELPALVVAELPDYEEGQGPDVQIVLDPAEPDPYESPRSGAFDSFEESVESRSLAFLSRPAEWSSAIKVLQGRSKYGPRGIAEATLLLRDLPLDGRYLIELDTPEPRATGATAKYLIDRIERRVALTLEHMATRGEDREE